MKIHLKKYRGEVGGDYAVCDITKEDIDAMTSKVVDLHGKLDIGIQATGWGYLSPFLESTEEDLVKIMNLQFKGPYQFFQSCIPAMKDGGNIIQISSATATIMLDNHAAYMGTKAGIDHVIRTIANEFGEKGIRANSISPGLTATPMTSDAMAAPGLKMHLKKNIRLEESEHLKMLLLLQSFYVAMSVFYLVKIFKLMVV